MTSFRSLALMLRGRAMLTQRELATILGVSERAIQVWEAGIGYPSPASLQRLIGLYCRRGSFSAGAEIEEAAGLWDAALAEAPRLKAAFDREWFLGLLATTPSTPDGTPPSPALAINAATRVDWGDAPAINVFHGRAAEQDTLASWLLDEECRVVGISGMGGIGKTALAARIAQELAPRFDAVFWRSLRNALPSVSWLAEAILFLSERHLAPPEDEGERRACLLELLRERRCLLVLDNLETILEPSVSPLAYRGDHTGYGVLLRTLSETAHHSTVLVTTREMPPELRWLPSPSGPVRVQRLKGLDLPAGQALLADKGLVGNPDDWRTLVCTYNGNALALQVVGDLIARVFGGQIEAFLAAGEAVFGDIRHLLRDQLTRLSATERALLFWLALEREPVDFNTLATDIGARSPRHEILEALQALDGRSLLEFGEGEPTFTLQPVVLEHVTDEIISICSSEITRSQPDLLVTHALVKADGDVHIRGTQERLVATPVLERLAATLPADEIDRLLRRLLDQWRGQPDPQQGFGPGNAVNLLRLHRGHLRGLDLSHLFIRHLNMWGTDAQDANLAYSQLDQARLSQQLGAAISAAISADGAYLAVGTLAGEARLWSLTDDSPALLGKQPIGPVLDVALAADGHLMATCGGPGTIHLWRPDDVLGPRSLQHGADELWCVGLSSDGRVAAGGGGDGTVRLWDTQTGECLQEITNIQSGLRGISLNRDGRLLATGSTDGAVAVWWVDGEVRLLHCRMYPGEARAIALSADGRVLANGDGDGVVHIRDAESGETRIDINGHSGTIWSVALTANGDVVASGGADRTLRFWNTHTGECLRVFHDHAGGVSKASITADGRLASSVALDGCMRVWDTRRGRCLSVSRGHVAAVCDVALSVDGGLTVTGDAHGNVRYWDSATGQCLRTLSGHPVPVAAVALSQRGDLAVSGSLEGTARVWSVPDGECLQVLTGHTRGVTCVALSPDGRTIVSGSFDGILRTWDAVTGECLAARPCDVSGVRGVGFSADGRVLVACGMTGTARVWDVQTGECLRVFEGDSGVNHTLAVDADGGLLAHATLSGRVRVWDIRTGECVRNLHAQPAGVRSVAITWDGAQVLTGGADGSLQVWDVSGETPRCKTLQAHSAEVWGIALSGDSRLAATAGFDGSVRLWDLSNGGVELANMHPDRPYERMNITGLLGVTATERSGLISLGAISA